MQIFRAVERTFFGFLTFSFLGLLVFGGLVVFAASLDFTVQCLKGSQGCMGLEPKHHAEQWLAVLAMFALMALLAASFFGAARMILSADGKTHDSDR